MTLKFFRNLLPLSIFIIFALIVMIFIPGPLKSKKIILIEKGDILSISNTLKNDNAIYSKYLFWASAQTMNLYQYLQAGEYEFNPGMSIIQIIQKIQSGESFKRSITIPEGYTTQQIIDTVKNDNTLSGESNSKYNEGDLLPETYYFTFGDTKKDILHRMKKSMSNALDKLWDSRDTNKLDNIIRNKHDALVLASIVEMESKTNADRLKIASVFLNRLKKNMKLEADPTTIYAITMGKYKLQRLLTKKDLQSKSQFNTYKHTGLPPTPIANPGVASLKSVLNPIETNYIFFVVENCSGSHAFAKNLKQHRRNVRNYRKLKCD